MKINDDINKLLMSLFEGDKRAAERWLNQPNKALGGKKPIDCVDTEAGADQVKNIIGRIEYGVYT